MKTSYKQSQMALSYLSDKTYQLFDGAIRTGKTKFGVYSFVDGTIKYTREPMFNPVHDNQHIVTAKNFRNIHENIQPYLLERFRSRGVYPALTQFGMWALVNDVTIRIMYFGANNKGSVSSVQGPTARSVLGDEVPTLDRATWEMAVSRTVTYPDAKIYGFSNPAGGDLHWYKQDYLDNKDLSKRVIHLTMYDNPILSEESIKRISAGFTDVMYKQKVLGLWVIGDGGCYGNVPKLTKSYKEEYDLITIGLDEGRKDATVLVAWGYNKKNDKWHVFDMFHDKIQNGNINALATQIVDWLNKIREENECLMRLECETNPGTMKNLIQRHSNISKGIIIEYVTKKKEKLKFKSTSAVQQRIDVVNMMLNLNKIVIHDKAKRYKQALEEAQYDDNGIRIDNGTSDIDTLDASEYGIKPYLKPITQKIYMEV